MTGRELILYILQNGLEDDPVVQDGKIVGFLTLEEAASKYDVGTATVIAWASLGYISCYNIGGKAYIPDIYEKKESANNG